jgi:hypothetical protein
MANLTQRFCDLSAGCEVDSAAVDRWQANLPTLRKLGEGYRMGWLHNVLARITPLTMQRKEDYIMMADLFVLTAQEADHVLDRFDNDLELFCSMAEIVVTPHMTVNNVSDELRAHINLYMDIQEVLCRKFKQVKRRDPIANLVNSPIMNENSNPFIKDFIDQKFGRKGSTSAKKKRG